MCDVGMNPKAWETKSHVFRIVEARPATGHRCARDIVTSATAPAHASCCASICCVGAEANKALQKPA